MEFTEEQIEKFRNIGLRLDRTGTFWQEGAPVTHQRLRTALLRWLDVTGDGRDIIRLDAKRYAYVDVEDAHLRARGARWDGDRCYVTWDDDQERELEYGSLRQADDNALYAQVGKLRGRIAGGAHHTVVERIQLTHGQFTLTAAGREWPVGGAT